MKYLQVKQKISVERLNNSMEYVEKTESVLEDKTKKLDHSVKANDNFFGNYE